MINNGSYLLEIAVSDFATAEQAALGGADRIELCANLIEGGTTPSFGTLKLCREKISIPVFPIIRPRGGDFLYTAEEFEIMCKDVLLAKEMGFDGVVIGLLSKEGSIDTMRTAKLVELAYPLEVTFHRAFDRCIDPIKALREIINCGCQRILSSGQQATATEGKDLLRELHKLAKGDIIIMPGSGVRKENITALRNETGCKEFHSSLRTLKPSSMNYVAPAFKNTKETSHNNWIESNEVAALKSALFA